MIYKDNICQDTEEYLIKIMLNLTKSADTELKILFSEDELLVVKKGNRLSILPIKNEVAEILLKKIKK